MKMKYFVMLVAMAILLVGVGGFVQAQDYVPGDVILSFKANITESEANHVINSHNLTWENHGLLKEGIWGVAKVPIGEEEKWIKILENDTKVKYAEKNGIIHALESANKSRDFNLSNGRKAEIKIMPETASARAIERLGELNFTVELKEVGKGNETRAVYELTGNKQGKFLGIFKIMAKVRAQVDAETGDVKVIKPWWSFLASGI
jgi:hypothetical protein